MTHNNRSVAENLRKQVKKLKDQLEAINLMVGSLVDYWRGDLDEENRPLQKYYVDAYRTVQENIKNIMKEGEA